MSDVLKIERDPSVLVPNSADPGQRRLRNAPLMARLMFRTTVAASGCWIWHGATNVKGYGHIRSDSDGPLVSVHRAVWEYLNGPIPPGHEIDHLCHVRNCVRPDHLDVVDHATNVRRRRPVTHCKYGHELTDENVWLDPRHGGRNCRRCATERMRRWRAAQQ